jgi:hypothetical protein
MKKIFLLLAFALPTILFAQRQATGNLTIFSEDGDKFYLILNGEKQNDVPQTNIRIEELPQPYYSARILFADSTMAPLSKNSLMITDADGTMMDVTYKIRKDKSKKAKLNYFSAIPVQQEYMPPAGMYVRRFGQPSPVSQTTTTTTTGTIGATINAPGINMNISINDPVESHTTTTTTTTSSSSHTSSQSNHSSNDGNCNGWPMKAGDFAAAKKTVSETAFEESKLSTAKSIAASNCLSSDQVVALCNLFSFEESKLTFAKYAYKYTTDPKNYFKVNNVFSFDSNKDELSKFISGD